MENNLCKRVSLLTLGLLLTYNQWICPNSSTDICKG